MKKSLPSEYAPATALMTLRPPTVKVTTTAATPLALAYPSAAYPAFNSLQQEISFSSSGNLSNLARRTRWWEKGIFGDRL